jgi:hypothetical protein
MTKPWPVYETVLEIGIDATVCRGSSIGFRNAFLESESSIYAISRPLPNQEGRSPCDALRCDHGKNPQILPHFRICGA